MENLDLPAELDKLELVHRKLAAHPDIHSIDSWYTDFKQYMNRHFLQDTQGASPHLVLYSLLFSNLG